MRWTADYRGLKASSDAVSGYGPDRKIYDLLGESGNILVASLHG